MDLGIAIWICQHKDVCQVILVIFVGKVAAPAVTALPVVVINKYDRLVTVQQSPGFTQGLEVLYLTIKVGRDISAVLKLGYLCQMRILIRLNRFTRSADHFQKGPRVSRIIKDSLKVTRRNMLCSIYTETGNPDLL